MTETLDNRAHRIRTLKEVIRKLHQGGAAAAEEVSPQLKDLVRETNASEIAAMEQELLAEEMPVEEIGSMCDFAVRDPQGRYLGTLEVTQDRTLLRALEGERRLLQYDAPTA